MYFLYTIIIGFMLCNTSYAKDLQLAIHGIQIDWSLLSHSVMGVFSNPIIAGLMMLLVINALLGGKKHVKKAAIGKDKYKNVGFIPVEREKVRPVPFKKQLRYTVHDGNSNLRFDRLAYSSSTLPEVTLTGSAFNKPISYQAFEHTYRGRKAPFRPKR